MLLKRNKTNEYRQELKFVYPEQAEKIANAAVTFAAGDLLFFQYPLFELVVRASLAAGAHTDAAVGKLKISDAPVVKIPLLQLPTSSTATNLLPGKLVVASFGYATQAKRLSTVLEVLAHLRPLHPNLAFVIVGAVEDAADLKAKIELVQMEESVIITGHVELQEFLSWMARADIVVNLRYPSAGEMSATLIQSLASGKPVIISRLLNLQELPEKAVMRVRPDQEREDLTEVLSALLKDEKRRQQLSMHASKFIEQHHSPDKVREQYKILIETAMERKPLFSTPELPFHLKSAKEIMKENLMKTSFAGLNSTILDWL